MSGGDAGAPSWAAKLALLGGLYFAQGLPFGFFQQALPVVLREEGVSLEAIGLSTLLALPWALKFLIGPWVDGTRGLELGAWRLGRRRAWILPLQLSSILLLLGLSFWPPSAGLVPLLAAVLLTNLAAATQDVAADGLAVEVLMERERGLGNGLQVAAYRAGMILGGGVILAFVEQLGWGWALRSMALALALASVPIARWREPVLPSPEPAPPSEAGGVGWIERLSELWAAVRALGLGWLVLLGAFKAGDAFGSTMLRPFLVDLGLGKTEIAWLLGIGGFTTGLLGALAGGWLAGRYREPALVLGGLLQATAFGAYVVVAFWPTPELLIGACLYEHFAGGVATVALFTVMMDACRRGLEATDYTLMACAVVLVGGVVASLSGFAATRVGYEGVFLLAGLGAAGGAWVMVRVLVRVLGEGASGGHEDASGGHEGASGGETSGGGSGGGNVTVGPA